ncbi:MAG TPA: hypothetical protein VFY29_19685 [Terriglobia bacterium]|nr:hypothetical protein [Terriglobia bacterium]
MRSYYLIRPALLVGFCLCVSLVIARMYSDGAAAGRDDVSDFQARIDSYIEIQRRAMAAVPPISNSVADPAVIIQHESDLANAIRALRPNAAEGDLFLPGVREVIVAIVDRQLAGPNGEAVRDTILSEGNPAFHDEDEAATPVKLIVNRSYPSAAPLSTMPPSLLLTLPRLPQGLEYRFVGHCLILRDTEANLIVDVIWNVF